MRKHFIIRKANALGGIKKPHAALFEQTRDVDIFIEKNGEIEVVLPLHAVVYMKKELVRTKELHIRTETAKSSIVTNKIDFLAASF